MTSLSKLQNDLSKILSVSKWLLKRGFIYKVENEYLLKFIKEEVIIDIYYGRYSDVTDVLIAIDSYETERYKNGNPVKYSVFESVIVNLKIENFAFSDGYEKAKAGIDILRSNNNLFNVRYLKKIRKKYQHYINSQLPESLRDIC